MHPPAPVPTAPTPPPALDLTEDLWLAWDRFFSALRQARGRAARRSVEGELTLSQYKLLVEIEAAPAARIGELAEAAGVAQPTATRMISGLEEHGLIERTRCAEDRRACVVALTSRGRDLYERKDAEVKVKRRKLLDSLDPTERAQAAHLLTRLAEELDAL